MQGEVAAFTIPAFLRGVMPESEGVCECKRCLHALQPH